MVAPYKRGEYYRSVYFSKASAVEEDHSKSPDDKTRISREPDVVGELINAKGHNVASAVSLVSEYTKTKRRFPKGYQPRERYEPTQKIKITRLYDSPLM